MPCRSGPVGAGGCRAEIQPRDAAGPLLCQKVYQIQHVCLVFPTISGFPGRWRRLAAAPAPGWRWLPAYWGTGRCRQAYPCPFLPRHRLPNDRNVKSLPKFAKFTSLSPEWALESKRSPVPDSLLKRCILLFLYFFSLFSPSLLHPHTFPPIPPPLPPFHELFSNARKGER